MMSVAIPKITIVEAIHIGACAEKPLCVVAIPAIALAQSRKVMKYTAFINIFVSLFVLKLL